MKPSLFLILLAAASHTHAGSPEDAITVPGKASPWRFGVGYAPLIGLETEFTGLGTYNRNFNAQPLGGGRNHNYDNGFVRVDSSGNNNGDTWNWSYQDAAQYDPANGGSISYTLTNSQADAAVTEDGENATGFECYTYYDMGTAVFPKLKDLGATWGFRGGLHYAHVDVGNSAVLNSSTFVLTDRFNLGGVTPPAAPHTGTFNGPGPLIGDAPIRSTADGAAALVSGSRELDVHLTTLSFGSYLEMPVCRSFSVLFEGGLNAAVASGDYDFQSTTAIAGLGSKNSSGSDSETRILPGAYLGLSGVYQLNPNWSIQASGRYQYLDDFSLGENGSEAELSFGSAFILSLGASYSF
jgi:hypothetical protein